MTLEKLEVSESPRFMRMSLAAAMTLDFKPGLFYRNAKLYCINLLLTYRGGCAARCAYCGLSKKRSGSYGRKSFIRVTWPTYELDEIIERIADRTQKVKRICISMITNGRAVRDTREVCARLRGSFDVPVSLLISPTVLDHADLVSFREAGADKIGVAIDLATPELFDRFRGAGVGGPHRWETYWACLEDALRVFGEGNAGSHFMVGMGETEREMCRALQRVRDMGGRTHLFSFFPEAGSAMDHIPSPPMDQYRRIQTARYLIDNLLGREEDFCYSEDGRIIGFGSLREGAVEALIETGEPFRTSGCRGYDGEVACNRPYANSRPGPDIRNFPFRPSEEDILRIRRQMGLSGLSGEDPDREDASAL
jgi:biotin synthase-related radical SAM superfamily protein